MTVETPALAYTLIMGRGMCEWLGLPFMTTK